MKLFSTKTHGVLDYLTAGGLLVLPRALGWSDKLTTALSIAALGTVAYSALTRYELGLLKTLPMPAHLALDALSGALFCAAPLLLPDEDAGVRGALLGIGLFELSAALLTEPEPKSEWAEKRLALEA
ncbi:MAG TPA: hypothetical protein VFS21_32570 [Roseiflexaceae bacterium]|nr:hypothetical protein [Roseiflexaceae bacterium]